MLVYHFMFGPDYTAGCPSCSAIADGFNGSRSTWPATTSRSARSHGLRSPNSTPTSSGWLELPVGVLLRQRLQLRLRGGAHQTGVGGGSRGVTTSGHEDLRPAAGEAGSRDAFTEAIVGTNWETYRREGPGMSAFARRTTPSTTRTPRTRGDWTSCGACTSGSIARRSAATKPALWWHRHDEYDSQ